MGEMGSRIWEETMTFRQIIAKIGRLCKHCGQRFHNQKEWVEHRKVCKKWEDPKFMIGMGGWPE